MHTNMDAAQFSEDDDDAMFEVSFERIHTPVLTVRSSTKISTDSPGSKLRKFELRKKLKSMKKWIRTYVIIPKWMFKA